MAVAVCTLLVGVAAIPAAQARTETFRFAYAGYGDFENQSQVDDNAGCRRNEDWVGHYSFRQDWNVSVEVMPHRIAIHRTAQYVGNQALAGHPTSVEVTGTQTAQPGQDCEAPGLTNDTGRYQCGDAHPALFFDKVLHIAALNGKRELYTAPAFLDYNPTLTGSNSIPSLRASGCSSISFSPGRYAVGPDIEVRIPISASTLYHLKLKHYFKVDTRLGHYTVLPDQTGKSCFQVTRGPNDFCHVTKDDYTGEVLVKRLT
jgi:hypothetical protein